MVEASGKVAAETAVDKTRKRAFQIGGRGRSARGARHAFRAVTVVHLTRPLGLYASAAMSRYLDPSDSSKPYKDPTPLPADIPKVKELGTTSAPLKSAAFFLGAFCKDYNGTCLAAY